MSDDSNRVIVVGGGIGGLSAALAMQRAGIPVIVFERAPELGEVGTGVGVWLNGTAALDRLGAGETVQRLGSPVEHQEICSSRGETMIYLPVGELARKYRTPPAVIIRRTDVLKALTDALDLSAVRLGSTFVGYDQNEDGITARFEDGSSERGAALIGADGIASAVRATVAPTVKPRYAGYQYLRGLTRSDEKLLPPNVISMTFRGGDRFGMSNAGGGQMYWWAVPVAPEGTGDPPEGRKQDVLKRFGRFPKSIPEIIDSTDEEAIHRNDIFDLAPTQEWDDGRVTLLGDAAHATTPNLGRGASEAIEDAAILAECLRAAGDLSDSDAVKAALRDYETRRQEPTAKVQSTAWKIGKMASWKDPVRVRVRELVMRRITSRAMPKGVEKELAASVGERAAR